MPLFGSKHKSKHNHDTNVQQDYQATGPTGPFQPDYRYGQPTQMPESGTEHGPNAGLYHDENHPTSGGTGTKLTGKVETALGSMVGSSALKAKGLEKEREANVAHMQGLAEAERLEREAMIHRQNVVGQGAHPANASPGAGVSTGTRPAGNQFHGVASGKTGGYHQ